jgi:hypothetical protein
MFLLLPLLSSPVAASFTTFSSVATNNVPAWPVVTITVPANTVYTNTGGMATFQLNYSFGDTNGPGLGSNHRATLTVTRTPGPQPGGSPATTGWVFVAAGAGTGAVTGTLTITDTWSPPASVTWDIEVIGECIDLQTTNSQTDTDCYQVSV